MSVPVHTRVTHQEIDSMGYSPYWRKFAFTFEDLDASYKFMVPIQAGDYIMGVALKVTTKFDNTATATVGDSGDVDEFVTSSDVHTAVTVFTSLLLSADAVKGKSYAADDYLVVTLSALPTVGEAELCVLMSGLEE